LNLNSKYYIIYQQKDRRLNSIRGSNGEMRQSSGPGKQFYVYEAQYVFVRGMSEMPGPEHPLQIPIVLSHLVYGKTRGQRH
jgi:hypothetical protein